MGREDLVHGKCFACEHRADHRTISSHNRSLDDVKDVLEVSEIIYQIRLSAN